MRGVVALVLGEGFLLSGLIVWSIPLAAVVLGAQLVVVGVLSEIGGGS